MNRQGELGERVLALTLTYKRHRYIYPDLQFRDTVYEVQRKLRRCCKWYILSPELTENNDIHYHCKLVLKDRTKWHKHVLPSFRRNGFVLVKPVKTKKDNDKWTDYLLKDTEMMEEILSIKLPLTSENKVKYASWAPIEESKALDDIMDKLNGISIIPIKT